MRRERRLVCVAAFRICHPNLPYMSRRRESLSRQREHEIVAPRKVTADSSAAGERPGVSPAAWLVLGDERSRRAHNTTPLMSLARVDCRLLSARGSRCAPATRTKGAGSARGRRIASVSILGASTPIASMLRACHPAARPCDPQQIAVWSADSAWELLSGGRVDGSELTRRLWSRDNCLDATSDAPAPPLAPDISPSSKLVRS
jgi:hypothetical protein